MTTNKITALYCRVSREDELKDISSSIETQKVFLKRYANQHKYQHIKFYIDDGHSGTTFERPGFTSLKEDIENHQVGIVITRDLSRLGRDYLTTGYYIEHYFPSNKVRYIAINDQVDTEKSDNDFAPFRNIMNEWYARDISKKIRSAYQTKALNGDFTGAYPPYGYQRHPEDKHKLVINKKQAIIIKKIFQLYLEGISLYKISKILKQKQVLTPRAATYDKFGVYYSSNVANYPYSWSTRTLINILNNEEYIGKIICNKHQTQSYKSKQLKLNDKSKWIVRANMHTPIIDELMFDKVQQRIRKNHQTTIIKHENMFKGKLRCHECGKTFSLSIRPDRNNHRSFACSTYRADTSRCTSHYISYEYLKETLKKSINRVIILSKLGKSTFINKHKKHTKLNQRTMALQLSISNHNQRLDEINSLTKKLFEKYVHDKIKEDKFYELDHAYDLEKINLVKCIRNDELELVRLKDEANDIDKFYDVIMQYDEIKDLKREHIIKLIDKVIIHEEKNNLNQRIIDVYFKDIGKM